MSPLAVSLYETHNEIHNYFLELTVRLELTTSRLQGGRTTYCATPAFNVRTVVSTCRAINGFRDLV